MLTMPSIKTPHLLHTVNRHGLAINWEQYAPSLCAGIEKLSASRGELVLIGHTPQKRGVAGRLPFQPSL
jgi:hypothetical protein